MTADLLVELARRGAHARRDREHRSSPTWNAGDADHPSMETIWDAALGAGVDAVGRRVRRCARLRRPRQRQVSRRRRLGHREGTPRPAGDPRRARRRALLRVDGRRADARGGRRRRARRRGRARANAARTRSTSSRTASVVATSRTGRVRHAAIPQTGYVRAVVTRDDGKQGVGSARTPLDLERRRSRA